MTHQNRAAFATAFVVAATIVFLRAGAPSPPVTTPHDGQDERVVITGSRIPRRDFASHSPLATVSSAVMDEGGDLAVLFGNSALYERRSGATTLTKIFESGVEIPGLPGTVSDTITPFRINNNGFIAFRVDTGMSTGELQGTVSIFDGTNYHVVANGADLAPNSGGARYERNLTLVGFNDANDTLMTANLLNGNAITGTSQPTLFLAHFNQAPIRLVGVGDPVPGMPGATFSNVTVNGFNNQGDVLYTGAISNGTGATGLFAYDLNLSLSRKIAVQNDLSPAGGTFSAALSGRINNFGAVMFTDNGNLFLNTSGGGTTVQKAVGSAAPASLGGTTSGSITIQAFNDAGTAVWTQGIAGSGVTTNALMRLTPGQPIEAVAYTTEALPGGSETVQTESAVSMNAAGVVTFVAGNATSQVGVFQQAPGGGLILVERDGQQTGTADGGTFSSSVITTQTLNTGAAIFQTNIADGVNDANVFRWSDAVNISLINYDNPSDPPGDPVARIVFMEGAGNFVSVPAAPAGGLLSYFVTNLSTGTSRLVATDEDPSPLNAGGRLRISNASGSIWPDKNGGLPFLGTISGGANPGNVILEGLPNGTISKIAAPNDVDNGGRTLTVLNFPLSGLSPLTSTGKRIFRCRANNVANTIELGQAGATPVKVAMIGDATTLGQPLTTMTPSNVSSSPVHGAGDQVIFAGGTVSSNGIFLSSNLGHIPAVLLNQAMPGGGTLSGIRQVVANESGRFVFAATTNGGPGSGIYEFIPGTGVAAIALNGAPAPGGGTFVMSTAFTSLLNAVVNNDENDIAYWSNLGGIIQATHAYFRRLGPNGTLQRIVAQGDPAPGTPTTFYSLPPTVNAIPGEFFHLAANGDMAFRGAFQPSPQLILSGEWLAEADNSIVPVLLKDPLSPAFGGGVPAFVSQKMTWIDGGRLAFRASVAGGSFKDAIMVSVPISKVSTGLGSNVIVTPVDPVTGTTPVSVQFSNVTQPGDTSLEISRTAPGLSKTFLAGDRYFEIETTAQHVGPITVCVDFSGQAFAAGAVLQLLHFEGNAWVNTTTSHPTPTSICGVTNDLSPFVVAQALNETTTNIIQNGTFSSGMSNWQVFELPDIVHNSAVNGVFEFYQANPQQSATGQAVVLQDTGVPFAAGAPVVAHFDLGNSDPVRKRISVLIRSADFTDLHVCTFWLPANAPMRTYAMRTHSTIAWTGASISFYAATRGSNGGAYQLDNVVMGPGSDLNLKRTDCSDPLEPGTQQLPDGPSLITDGSFSGGDGPILNGANLNSPWVAFGTLTAQTSNGVAQFIRPSNAAPSGALVQVTGVPVTAGHIVTAHFDIGNSSGARKRITVLIHDQNFVDLSACTFWLPAGQPLSSYTMRSYVTSNWSSAMISFYPATTDVAQWFELDNVSMAVTPEKDTFGADCVEPGDVSVFASLFIGGLRPPIPLTRSLAELASTETRSGKFRLRSRGLA